MNKFGIYPVIHNVKGREMFKEYTLEVMEQKLKQRILHKVTFCSRFAPSDSTSIPEKLIKSAVSHFFILWYFKKFLRIYQNILTKVLTADHIYSHIKYALPVPEYIENVLLKLRRLVDGYFLTSVIYSDYLLLFDYKINTENQI